MEVFSDFLYLRNLIEQFLLVEFSVAFKKAPKSFVDFLNNSSLAEIADFCFFNETTLICDSRIIIPDEEKILIAKIEIPYMNLFVYIYRYAESDYLNKLLYRYIQKDENIDNA